jgi:hypothetical protein
MLANFRVIVQVIKTLLTIKNRAKWVVSKVKSAKNHCFNKN